MKHTLREVFRLIVGTKKIFISLSLILGLGSLLLFGLTSDIESFDVTVQAYKNECDVPDATVFTSFFNPNSLDADTDFGRLEYSWVCDCAVTSVGGRRLTGRTLIDTTAHLESHYRVIEELPISEEADVLNVSADILFTEFSDISLGDTVDAETPFGTIRYYVYRILTGPDNFSVSRDRINTFDSSDFGYLMIDRGELFDYFGLEENPSPFTIMGLIVNAGIIPTTRISVYTDVDTEEAARDAIELLKNQYTVLDSYTDEDSPHTVVYETSTDPIRAAGSFSPYLIFGVAVLVSVLFSLQLLHRQRREIGILRALGYSVRQISVKYLLYHLMISLTALLVGIGGGCLLTKFMLWLQITSFAIPKTVFVMSLRSLCLSAAVILPLGQIGTLIFVLRISHIDPVEAMTADAPKTVSYRHFYKPRFLSEIAVSHMRFARRNKMRTLFSCFGITLTALFILNAICYSGAVYRVSSDVFDYRLNYDACLVLQRSVSPTEKSPFEDCRAISACEPVGQTMLTIFSENGEEECCCNALSDSSSLLRIRDQQRNLVDVSSDGIVLEYHTAERLGVSIGDTVTVNDQPLTVNDLCYHTAMHTQYVSFETLQKLTGSDRVVTGYMVQYNPAVTGDDTRTAEAEQKFYDALQEDDEAFSCLSYISYTRALRESVETTLSLIVPGIAVMVLCGFLIGFLIIVNIGNLNYLERKRDYSILMVQGYNRFRAVSGTLTEHFAEYLFAMLVCVIGGLPLARTLISDMETDRISFHVVNEGLSVLLTAVFLALFLVVVNIPLLLRSRRADVSEALKAKE